MHKGRRWARSVMGPEGLHLLTRIFSPVIGPVSVIDNKDDSERETGVGAGAHARVCLLLARTSGARTVLEQRESRLLSFCGTDLDRCSGLWAESVTSTEVTLCM